MPTKNPSEEELRRLLESARTIAVVGCSPDPARTSHQIAASLQQRGFRVVPVHPAGGVILGEKAYASLDDLPAELRVDVVDVFRRAEETPVVAEAAVRIGARALWLQQGIVSEEARDIAERGGLLCVMDRCLGVASRTLLGGGKAARPEAPPA